MSAASSGSLAARLRGAAHRVAGLFSRRRREADFRDELEAHLAMRADELEAAGVPAGEARRRAAVELGGVEATRQAYRDQATLPWLEQLFQDVRFALRQLVRSPSFTATAVATLATALGVALVVAAFVDAATVSPLPYRDPGSLLEVTESVAMMPRANLSWDDYLDWKEAVDALDGFDAHRGARFALRTADGMELLQGARVTTGFFRTLGIAPAQGRDFVDGDPETSVILSHLAWQTRLGGRPDVVGSEIVLDGAPSVVVGVLPARFHFAPRGRPEVYIPFHPQPGCDERRSCHAMVGVGRIAPGSTLQQVREQTTAIATRLEELYPESNSGQGASVTPLTEAIVGEVLPVLWVVGLAAALLLVIACVNVSSLLLVRSEGRKRELAVRSTLGATGGRLVRQLVTEAVLLVAAAAGVGLLVAEAVLPLVPRLIPAGYLEGLPFLDGVGLEPRVLAGYAAVAALAVVLFSLVPALRVGGRDMRDGLAEGGRGASGRTWRRLGFRLVVAELAIAVLLLAGAGLLGRSLHRLLDVELAFQPEGLVAVTLAATGPRFDDTEAAGRLNREVVEAALRVPGVTSAALTSVLPVSFNGNTTWVRFVGRPWNGEHNEVNMREVSAGYFETLGVQRLAGRSFTTADDTDAPSVAIVNRRFVDAYFGDENPLGQRIGDVELSPDSISEIVGVVDDVREGGLSDEIWPAVYYPMAQGPNSYFGLVARSAGDPRQTLPALVEAARAVDPELGVVETAVMAERIETSPAAYLQRSSAWLVGGFALLALILGTVGLYGVVAYTVGQRAREIGLRFALGARRGDVYGMVLGEAGRSTALGLVLGLAASVAGAHLLGDLLFETRPWDFPTLLAVAAVLAAAALLASYLPARRAAAVDPVELLQHE